MHRITLLLWSLAISLLLSSAALGQGLLQTKGKAIVNPQGDTIILRGMGLGGWMVQEGYMLQTAAFANPQHKIREKIEELIGPADTDAFYDAWLANHCRKADIDSLKAWGFNSVRIPMHYNLFTLPIEDEPVAGQQTWLTKGFVLLDSVVSWCKQNEMYVVLDMHATPGGQGYDEGISDYDPTKPSLWESNENKQKLVSLWARLAKIYADEPWIAGYDLINEPNWNLPGGTALRAIYEEITDSIRLVDPDHIIFIEGNWFANDFTGLTPPWDPNLVYSPHKYWSLNDQGSIQWVLDLQATYNVPLYLGESGENSNTWFRNAIALIESNGIGWAWWPLKKIEAIAGPLSVTKTPDYQTLLSYWGNGGNKPSAAFSKATLMNLTELLKIENCFFQKDVIDAMFRQIEGEDAIPYRSHNIPGIIYATDFDMGRNGVGYFDANVGTYHVTTGNYTAWNSGWNYRNDGVDIERCQDNTRTNGFNVGWLNAGEWMQYEVNVAKTAVYRVELRMATPSFSGSFHLSIDGSDLSGRKFVPSSGGYQTWNTVTLDEVVLTPGNHKLRFYSEGSDYNFSSMSFVEVGPTTNLTTDFLSAYTLDAQTIQLDLNKPLESAPTLDVNDFEIYVDGTFRAVREISRNPENDRSLILKLYYTLSHDEIVKISYTGNQINAMDGGQLATFSLENVQNRAPIIHPVPGRVEAEEYFFHYGTGIESNSDGTRGKNLSNLDQGDYADFYLNVPQNGVYNISYRTAAETERGEIKLLLMDENYIGNVRHTVGFIPTGSWQTYTNTSASVSLPAGRQHIRLEISGSSFNLNWFEVTLITSNEPQPAVTPISLYPNPGTGLFTLAGTSPAPQPLHIQVYNAIGVQVWDQTIQAQPDWQTQMDLSPQAPGTYFVVVRQADGQRWTKRLIKR